MSPPVSRDDRGSSIEAIEFLARSGHRVSVLTTLAAGPRSRDELRSATGASSPTLGRVLSAFEERHWLISDGRQYELTELGEFVTGRFLDLCEAMETERALRDVWRWLPTDLEGFSIEFFDDPVVSYPGPGYPYEPVERVTQLIENADEMRGFGTTVVKSGNLEAACDAIIDGMTFEFVYTPAVLQTIIEWNPERVAEAARCENCTTLVHDAIPDSETCGLGIYDERVGICCHDAETGVLQAAIDTDSPAAFDWADAAFERYRAEARRVEDADLAEFLDFEH